MSTIVHCPSCDHPATVAEFEVPIVCASCGITFIARLAPPPPESAPAAPKLPGYGPRGESPRRTSPRSRKPDERKPATTVHITRRAVAIGAVGLVGLTAAAGGAGWWAIRRANRAAGGAGDGWQTHALPEAPEVTVEFPALPAVVEEPVDIFDLHWQKVTNRTSFQAFKCQLPGGEAYAVRVIGLEREWEWLRVTSEGELRKEKLQEFAKLLRGADWKLARQQDRVLAGGYDSSECFLPVVESGRPTVFRSVLVHDRVYILYVSGPGVSPDALGVRRFFDSFRHARFPPEPSTPPPPTAPQFRPLARISEHVAAVFVPQQSAVVLSCKVKDETVKPKYGEPFSPSWIRSLRRYHYPSFRCEAVVPLETLFCGAVADERAGAIYGFGELCGDKDPHSRYGFAAYSIPAATAGDRPAELARPRSWTKTPLYGPHVLASPDRRYLYVSFVTRRQGMDMNEGTFWAIDPLTGQRTAELKLHATAPLSVSPDGARLYTITYGERPGDAVAELDPITLRVVRKFNLRSRLDHVAALGGERLLGFSGHVGGDRDWKSVLIDLNADVRERLVERSEYIGQHALRGDRVYACGYEVGAWDVSGAAAGRVRRLEALPVIPHLPGYASDRTMCVSPDGKCLISSDGRVYWLDGAGPLPKIDPEASWISSLTRSRGRGAFGRSS